MVDLDDIYNLRILELAANIPRSQRLERPEATASAHSKLCGSTISIDLNVREGRIVDFAQTVKACLLGQASAAIVGREIVGTTADEFRSVAAAMRMMLKANGPPPAGRWADLALLAPVKDYTHRQPSTLLVFDAVEKALDEIGSRAPARAAVPAPAKTSS
jgi:NifU-like protein involved in Fe-S cluster formation